MEEVNAEMVECLRIALMQWKKHSTLNPADINPAIWYRCTQALADGLQQLKLEGQH